MNLMKTEDVCVVLGITRGQFWSTVRFSRATFDPYIMERKGRGRSGGLWWSPEVVAVIRDLRSHLDRKERD